MDGVHPVAEAHEQSELISRTEVAGRKSNALPGRLPSLRKVQRGRRRRRHRANGGIDDSVAGIRNALSGRDCVGCRGVGPEQFRLAQKMDLG